MKLFIALLSLCLIAVSCGKQNEQKDTAFQKEAQKFLDEYNKEFQTLYAEASEAQWILNTKIVEGDTATAKMAEEVQKKNAEFTGSIKNINAAKKFLERKDELTPLQRKQFEAILFMAAQNPQTVKDIVDKRIKAETKQTQVLYGYDFKVDGKSITPNRIDETLEKSKDVNQRLKVWKASKEVGKELKGGLEELVDLRNKTVQALGYKDYFQYQVSEYGMKKDEMMDLCKQMVRDIWPLYRELHTWARYELASRYNQPVPNLLPAHWLPDRWGQDWTAMVDVKGINLDSALKGKSAEWVVKKGEEFYSSLGFAKLPETFYTKSSLYPLDETAGYKKNTHASAWHMDLGTDVRSLMSVEPNTRWWSTTLHELGHIYYYMEYTNDSVPLLLRSGANRAYHEAFGSMIGLASMQTPFLEGVGLAPKGAKVDEIQSLLKEALDFIVFIPWSAGVMTVFEHDLYSKNLPQNEYNKRWWELVRTYQGIEPPEMRGEEYCDACTKTHINDDAAQYYDYALSYVLLLQFHDHIAREILKQDPHKTNYWGNKEVGKFLHKVMSPGATVDWREHLKKSIGSEMSAKPMLNYFEPLLRWLKSVNKGRNYTLTEKPELR